MKYHSLFTLFIKNNRVLFLAFVILTTAIFYTAFFSEKTFTQSQNQPPIASGDSFSGVAARNQGPPGVLANDSDPDGDSLRLGGSGIPPIAVSPTHGSLYLNGSNGSFTYTPSNGYTGDDSFNKPYV